MSSVPQKKSFKVKRELIEQLVTPFITPGVLVLGSDLPEEITFYVAGDDEDKEGGVLLKYNGKKD